MAREIIGLYAEMSIRSHAKITFQWLAAQVTQECTSKEMCRKKQLWWMGANMLWVWTWPL